MDENPRIAVAGAGSLGVPVILALLDASYPVTILTRSTNHTKDGIPPNANVQYVTVDYSSVGSLEKALEGHFGVVSTVTTMSAGEQDPLIEAAVRAGVSRFIPSEFGSDSTNSMARVLPVYATKVATQGKLKEVAARNPGFSYTSIGNGPFLDWGLATNFLMDLKNRSATIYDGGDSKFSVTTLTGVAKAVVGVFRHLEETKNRHILVHEAVVSQNQIIGLARRRDPASWNLHYASTEESRSTAFAVLSRGNPDEVWGAMVGLLAAVVYGQGYGSDFTGKTENNLLEVDMLTEKELEEVIARYL